MNRYRYFEMRKQNDSLAGKNMVPSCRIIWIFCILSVVVTNVYLYFSGAYSNSSQQSMTSTKPVLSESPIVDIQSVMKPKVFTSDTVAVSKPIVKNSNKTIKNGPKKKKSISKEEWKDVSKTNLMTTMKWDDFIAHSSVEESYYWPENPLIYPKERQNDMRLNICSPEITFNLRKPRLSEVDIEFCNWAVKSDGGQVVVGQSWGKLGTKKFKPERIRFDELNCNAVIQSNNNVKDHNKNNNPSCDYSWGDIHVENWVNNEISPSITCRNPIHKSSLSCFKNENNAKFCVMENVQIDFSKVRNVPASNQRDHIREFKQDFMSLDCLPAEPDRKEVRAELTEKQLNHKIIQEVFPFPHLLSTSLENAQCNVIINETVLLYSHDPSHNLAHTLNDIMNVWLMLWLNGLARVSNQLSILNIDGLVAFRNIPRTPIPFFHTYLKNFKALYNEKQFKKSIVCIRKLITQPKPSELFVWDSWHHDLPCSFVGPSSLFQRFNLHVRDSFGLLQRDLNEDKKEAPYVLGSKEIPNQILFIIRLREEGDKDPFHLTRLIQNVNQSISVIENVIQKHNMLSSHKFLLKVLDLASLDFEAQVTLISKSSILIGIHGAGLSSSLFMSIGSKFCCGVIEMFPVGFFNPIKGFGNMIRKMGIHYDRIDISREDSKPNGAVLPPLELKNTVNVMISKVSTQPSCVHTHVIRDPYLEKIKGIPKPNYIY